LSITNTSAPASEKARAAVRPTIPAPIITTLDAGIPAILPSRAMPKKHAKQADGNRRFFKSRKVLQTKALVEDDSFGCAPLVSNLFLVSIKDDSLFLKFGKE